MLTAITVFKRFPLVSKTMLFVLYLYYLSLYFGLTSYYIIPVFLKLYFDIPTKNIIFLIPVLYIADFTAPWVTPIEYGHYSLITFLKTFYNTKELFVLHAAAIIIFSLTTYLILFKLLKNFKNNLSFLMLCLMLILISHYVLLKLNLSPEKINFSSTLVFLIAFLFSKKIWLLFLAKITSNYLGVFSFKEYLIGLFNYSPFYRENFKLDSYIELNENESLKLYVQSALLILFAIAYFYLLKILTPESIIPELMVCPGQVSYEYYLKNIASNYFSCFTITSFLKGFIKHLFIDTLLLVIPGHLIGLNFRLPFGNFLNAKSFPELLSKSMYYYSLIINRIFIWEISKAFRLKSRKISTAIITFISVFVGGLFFHLNRDLNYIIVFGKNYYPSLFEGPILYFFLLSLFMTLKMRFFKLNIFNVIFWLVLLLLIRSLNTYYFLEPLTYKIQYLMKIIFWWRQVE